MLSVSASVRTLAGWDLFWHCCPALHDVQYLPLLVHMQLEQFRVVQAQQWATVAIFDNWLR